MFQNKKRIIILVLIMFGSIIANWEYIFNKKTATPVTMTAPANTPPPQVEVTADKPKKSALELPGKAADYAKMLLLAQGADWGDDPFGVNAAVNTGKTALPAASDTADAAPEEEEEEEKEELRLESVLVTPYQSVAVINGQMLVEGDEFLQRRVVKISKDKVLMRTKNGMEEIRLKDPDIPMAYIRTKKQGHAN